MLVSSKIPLTFFVTFFGGGEFTWPFKGSVVTSWKDQVWSRLESLGAPLDCGDLSAWWAPPFVFLGGGGGWRTSTCHGWSWHQQSGGWISIRYFHKFDICSAPINGTTNELNKTRIGQGQILRLDFGLLFCDFGMDANPLVTGMELYIFDLWS